MITGHSEYPSTFPVRQDKTGNQRRWALQHVNGVWFYGLAGSGKTLASKYVRELCVSGFVIDGDQVRQYVSQDLDYDLTSRQIQIQRILGISQIAIKNGFFPIASSVYMDQTVSDLCKEIGIKLYRIERDLDQAKAVRHIYTNTDNVVGKDLSLPQLATSLIRNDGTTNYKASIHRIFKEIICKEHA